MYDRVRTLMREIVEMPDRHADLFIKLVRQNNGELSAKKRKLPEFAQLSDDEIRAMEEVLCETLGITK